MDKKSKYHRLFIAAALLLSNSSMAMTIATNKVEGEKEELAYNILKLALSHTAPNTTYKQASSNLSRGALTSEIESGQIDVMWAGASELENQLRPVRIPILKGLLGHRIFIIRKGDQSKFDNITSLTQLKALQAGQGKNWGDTTILKSAGIPTVTTFKYANLFPMLEGGRFDYFPRAVHEPWSEVTSRPELGLTIEKKIMLIYPFAMYFYVGKNNRELHDLIYQGFEQAIQDGSFDKLFFANPMIKDVLSKAHLAERRVFRINNPNMHPDTPTDRQEFWLDVTQL
jgi:hypothetical protein